jgi:GTP pyrophosphokinase
MREENVVRGKEMLEREAKQRGYNLSELISNKEWLVYIKTRYNWAEVDEVFAAVGYGDLGTNQVILKALEYFNKQLKAIAPVLQVKSAPQKKSSKGESTVIIKGFSDFKIKLSQCCSPVPGDSILGYISRGRGVSIHRADCPNMKNVEQERLTTAEWPGEFGGKYTSSIEIHADNRSNLVLDIAQIISHMKLSISAMGTRVIKDTAIVSVSVEISSSAELEQLKKSIANVRGVTKVARQ